MNKNYIALLSFLLCVISCADNVEHSLEEAGMKNVCKLEENLIPIKLPQSFDILDDNRFVMTDWEGVYLYDFNGKQLSQIGISGRAQYEYNRPSIVRVYDNKIYVWSSATLKFIEYDSDGTPIAEYEYNSAVTDFRVSEDEIFIYTAGRKVANIIDVYDKSSETVTNSLTPSTREHRFSLRNISSSPMYYDGESLVYASKDKLNIYLYSPESKQTEQISSFSSKSFKVESVADTTILYTDWDKTLKYYNENLIALFICPSDKGYYMIAAEGKFEMKNNEIIDGTRYIALYDIRSKDSKHVASYKYSSIATQHLFAYYNGKLYIIDHSMDENDDIYTMKSMDL